MLKKTLEFASKTFSNKIVRFLLVGTLNTLFSYFVYSYMIFLGYKYNVVSVFQITLGVMFNYVTFGNMVFNNRGLVVIIKFIFGYIILYAVYTFGLYIFDRLQFNPYLSGFLMLFPSAVVSYVVNNYFVFNVVKVAKTQ